MNVVTKYYNEKRDWLNNEVLERELLGKVAPEAMCEHCQTISSCVVPIVFHYHKSSSFKPLNDFVVFCLCPECGHEYIDDAEQHSISSKVYRKLNGQV